MKFLLDQGLPRSTVPHLESMGHEAEHVGNLGLARASDETIINEGRSRGSVVVTLDLDKRKTLWLVLIASALPLLAPAVASSHRVLDLKTRAELKTTLGPNHTESVALSLETASRYYDPLWGTAFEFSVAPRSQTRYLGGHPIPAGRRRVSMSGFFVLVLVIGNRDSIFMNSPFPTARLIAAPGIEYEYRCAEYEYEKAGYQTTSQTRYLGGHPIPAGRRGVSMSGFFAPAIH